MNPIAVLAGLAKGDRQGAIHFLKHQVLELSEYGDHDCTLYDWIDTYDFNGTETVQEVTTAWDNDWQWDERQDDE